MQKQLHEEGHYLAGVPGFYHDMAGNWTISKERRGNPRTGLKNPRRKNSGLQIRLDSIKESFRWITSIGKQGWLVEAEMLDPYRWRAYPDSPSDRGDL